jgi:hypothetical protein
MPVYGAFGPIQLLLISFYFNYSVEFFKRKNIGIYIGVIGALVGYLNYFFIQSPRIFNNYFLIGESIIVVGMCLYSFYCMLQMDDDMKLRSNIHFWITAIFLFFWTVTFLFWGLYDFLVENIGVSVNLLHLFLLIVNVVTYISFGLVFIIFKKVQIIHEQ